MILTCCCFLAEALRSGAVADLVDRHDLGFVPETVRVGPKELRMSDAVVDEVRALSARSVDFQGPDGSIALAGVSALSAQLIILRSSHEPLAKMLDELSRVPGFVSAMVGDADDVFWQSAHSVNSYQVLGRPWSHLPTLPDPILRKDRIDVSQNPGRKTRGPGMWMWAASWMYFGPGAFLTLDRERLLLCPVGDVIEQGDIVVVKLYEIADDEADIRKVQRQFRDWMGYDEIEARARELIPPAQPAMIFEHGTFPNGGVKRITEWRRDSKLCYPQDATERRCFELDADGTTVWEESTPVETTKS